MQTQQQPLNHLQAPIAHARVSDPETSHAAAASVHHISELQIEILIAYRKNRWMRDDELINYLTTSFSGPRIAATEQNIRSRRAELAAMQLVEPVRDCTGREFKTKMQSGRLGQVWRVS